MFFLPENRPGFEVVLHRPEIAPNTGSIARMCACTGCRLHLVAPLGFSIDDAKLRRAGLDYWQHVYVATYASLSEIIQAYPEKSLHFFTTKTDRSIWDVSFKEGDLLVFGSESVGLPQEILDANIDKTVGIPMLSNRRSLNLSSSVAVAVYEAFRQNLLKN